MEWETRLKDIMKKANRCVVIEDLISTGKSSLAVIQALKSGWVCKLPDWFLYLIMDLMKRQKAFAAEGVKTRSLTDYPTLIGLAVEKGTVIRSTV